MVDWVKRILRWLARQLNEVQFLHVAAAKQLHPYLSRTTVWGWICRVRKLVFAGLGVYKFGQNLQRSCKSAEQCGTSGVMLTYMYLTARSAMPNLNVWVQANGALAALISNPTKPSAVVFTILGLFAFPALKMARVVKSSRLAGALKGLWKTLKALDVKAWVGSVGAIMLKCTHPCLGKVNRVVQAGKKVVRAVSGVKVHEWGLAAVLLLPKLGCVREWVTQAAALDAGVAKLLGCLNSLVSTAEWPLLFMAAPLKWHLMTNPAEAKLLEHSVAVVVKLNEWTHTHPAPYFTFMAGLWCAAIPSCRSTICTLVTPITNLKTSLTHRSKRLPLSHSMRIGSRLLLPPGPIVTPTPAGPTPPGAETSTTTTSSATPVPSLPTTFKQQCIHVAEATVQQLFVVSTTPAAAAAPSLDQSVTGEEVSGATAAAAANGSSRQSADIRQGLTLRSTKLASVLVQAAQPSKPGDEGSNADVRWTGLDVIPGFVLHDSICAVCGSAMAADDAEWLFSTGGMRHDAFVRLLGKFQPCSACQEFHVCADCHDGHHDQQLRDACWAGSALTDFLRPLNIAGGESKGTQ